MPGRPLEIHPLTGWEPGQRDARKVPPCPCSPAAVPAPRSAPRSFIDMR